MRSSMRNVGSLPEQPFKIGSYNAQCFSPTNRFKIDMDREDTLIGMHQSTSINLYDPNTYTNAYQDLNPAPHNIFPEDAEEHTKSVLSFEDERY